MKRYYCKAIAWWGTEIMTADFAYTKAGRKRMIAWMTDYMEHDWHVTSWIGKENK